MATLTATLKKGSSLRKESLYELEEIMGECTGHGTGFFREKVEDIDWCIAGGENWSRTLSIDQKGSKLVFKWQRTTFVSSPVNPKTKKPYGVNTRVFAKWAAKAHDEIVDLEWSVLPEKRRIQLAKLIRKHTTHKVPAALSA